MLLGTNRKDRQSDRAAKWIFSKMEERPDIDPHYFDVRDFDLPRDDYGTEIGGQFPEWRDAIIKADGLVIVTPEYNHGYPGVLKSVLDLLLKEYIHKAVATVSVSAGPWGGDASLRGSAAGLSGARPGRHIHRSSIPIHPHQVRRPRQPRRFCIRKTCHGFPRRVELDGSLATLGPQNTSLQIPLNC